MLVCAPCKVERAFCVPDILPGAQAQSPVKSKLRLTRRHRSETFVATCSILSLWRPTCGHRASTAQRSPRAQVLSIYVVGAGSGGAWANSSWVVRHETVR